MPEAGLSLEFQDAHGECVSHVLSGPTTIGREADCDLVLQNPAISRHHCQLRKSGAGWLLSDLGSSHGTWVNGTEITQVVVRHGDVIQLCSEVRLQVVDISARRPAAEPAPASDAAAARSTARQRQRTKARLKSIAAVLAVVGLAAFALDAWWTQHRAVGTSDAEGEARVASALSRIAAGDYDRAAQLLADLPRQELSEVLRQRVDGVIEQAQELNARRQEVLGTLQSIASNPDFGSLAELEAALNAARPSDVPHLIADSAWLEQLAQGRQLFSQRAQARAGAARAEAQDHLARRGYGKALRVLDDASRDASLDEAGRLRLRSLRERVDNAAVAEFESLRTRIRSAAPAAAKNSIQQALNQFEGTVHEGELRAMLAMLPLEVSESPVVAAAAKPAQAATSALRDALAAGENLAAKRDFARAAAAFAAAADSAENPASRDLCLRRKARMERMLRIPAILNARLLEEPARFRGISLGQEARGDLKSVDASGMEFQLGIGARLRIPWDRLEPQRQALIFHSARLRGDEARVAAEWMLEARMNESALTLLATVGARDAEFRTAVSDLVAEAKGLAAAPAGGFEFLDGSFLTAAEKSELAANRRSAQSAKLVLEGSGLEWRVALDALLADGDSGKALARKALTERRARMLAAAKSQGDFAGSAILKLRERLQKELEEARTHALELIRDTRRYPYPYGADQAQIQADVDARVQRVEELWTHPAGRVLDLNEDLRKAYAGLEEIARAILEAGGEAAEPTELLDWLNGRLAIQEPEADSSAAEKRSELLALVDGDQSMSREERDCIEATNAYRMMMGMAPVVPDERLVNCARGHSDEMQRLGYFAHTSPTKGHEGPGQRARLAGWTSGVSENIAMGQGSGAGAVLAWRHSSGHHRNLLGNWSHLGCGKASGGAYWTQNFSNGPIPKRSRPLEAGKGGRGSKSPSKDGKSLGAPDEGDRREGGSKDSPAGSGRTGEPRGSSGREEHRERDGHDRGSPEGRERPARETPSNRESPAREAPAPRGDAQRPNLPPIN